MFILPNPLYLKHTNSIINKRRAQKFQINFRFQLFYFNVNKPNENRFKITIKSLKISKNLKHSSRVHTVANHDFVTEKKRR